MSDLLLELAQRPRARRWVRTLGLPIPMPMPLRRAAGPWVERPLKRETVVVYGDVEGAVLAPTLRALRSMGAQVHVLTDAARVEQLDAETVPEAWSVDSAPPELRHGTTELRSRRDLRALVFDASGLEHPRDLDQLFNVLRPLVRGVVTHGRVVVLGRPPERCETPTMASTQRALDGFVRSLSKELGRRAIGVLRANVHEGAEDWLEGPLRFALTARSAYVTGQPIEIQAASSRVTPPTSWVRPLGGKVALVTGAGRGIGVACARALAREGAEVICLDRPDPGESAATIAAEIGGHALSVDLTALDAVDRIAAAVEARGGVDVLVHNAGITQDKTFAKMPSDRWQRVLQLNLVVVQRITRRLLDDGLLRDRGRVVCMASIAGLAGNMGQTHYAAAKAGLVGYAQGLSARLRGRDITVNAIAPGLIETPMTEAMPPLVREAARRLTSLGQGGLPEDVAEAVVFMSHPGAAGVTGATLRVCGGALIGA